MPVTGGSRNLGAVEIIPMYTINWFSNVNRKLSMSNVKWRFVKVKMKFGSV